MHHRPKLTSNNIYRLLCIAVKISVHLKEVCTSISRSIRVVILEIVAYILLVLQDTRIHTGLQTKIDMQNGQTEPFFIYDDDEMSTI